MTPDLPTIRWPQVWEKIFDEISEKIRKELAREEAAKRRAAGNLLAGLPSLSEMVPSSALVRSATPIDTVTPARRYDELVAASERAQQRVEDYEDEFRRLSEEHRQIVRPDARLWWGVVILIVFAFVGVGLPAWLMSEGPGDLPAVQWVVYPFGGALVVLLVYIVVYLAQLSSRRPPPTATGEGDDTAPPGADAAKPGD